ncbi:hypothetical protein, partial [Nitrosococcus oceani]|uniref:hypothetical protein n=1 Tax=Nitrosococcus oceani TaxID=1229 RepID=UPI001E4E0B7F
MGILIHRWQQAGVSGQRDVITLWQQHLALSAKWPRLKRVMLYVILFLGFGFSGSVLALEGPSLHLHTKFIS